MGDKKSFVMYTSWCSMFRNLPDTTLAQIMKAVAAYQMGEDYEIEDPAAYGIFQMIRQTFEEDAAKYEETCRRRAEAGSAGGKQKVANASKTVANGSKPVAKASKSKQKVAKARDNESEYEYEYEYEYDSDNDSESDNETDTEPEGSVEEIHCPAGQDAVAEIIRYLNNTCGVHYKASTDKTRRLIRARLNEKFTVDDFKTVIDKKRDEWLGTDMEQYLRPETLFGTKFEGYLNQSRGRPKVSSFDVLRELYRKEEENDQEGNAPNAWVHTPDVSEAF